MPCNADSSLCPFSSPGARPMQSGDDGHPSSSTAAGAGRKSPGIGLSPSPKASVTVPRNWIYLFSKMCFGVSSQ